MILSRTLAKQRMERGVRPSVIGAWGPVGFDLAVVAFVAWIIWLPLSAWIVAGEMSIYLAAGLLFCLLFIPSQFLLILSAIWAVKSRWVEETPET